MSHEYTKSRWEYIKRLRPSPGRYIHLSGAVWPAGAQRVDAAGVVHTISVPSIQKPGVTFRRRIPKHIERAALKARAKNPELFA